MSNPSMYNLEQNESADTLVPTAETPSYISAGSTNPQGRDHTKNCFTYENKAFKGLKHSLAGAILPEHHTTRKGYREAIKRLVGYENGTRTMLGKWDEETKSAIRDLAVEWSTYAVGMGVEPGGAQEADRARKTACAISAYSKAMDTSVKLGTSNGHDLRNSIASQIRAITRDNSFQIEPDTPFGGEEGVAYCWSLAQDGHKSPLIQREMLDCALSLYSQMEDGLRKGSQSSKEDNSC